MLQQSTKFIIIICLFSILLPKRSMEFTSAKTFARVEGDYEKAEEYGLKALEKDPNNSYIAYFLAKEVFLPQKKKDRAGEMFVKAIQAEDTKIEKPFRIGDEFIRTVHKAAKLYADEFYNYAVDEYNKKNFEKAIGRFDVALKLDSKHLRSILGLAEIYFKEMNNLDQSLIYLDQGLSISDDSKQIEGIILTKANYYRKKQFYDEALSSLMDNMDRLGLMGRRELFLTYIDLDKLDEAINLGEGLVQDMETELSIDQSQLIAESAYNLAICYRTKGMINYNIIVDYLVKSEKNLDSNKLHSKLCEETINYFEQAKESFQLATIYDETGTTQIKEYKKEMRKMKRKVEQELLPELGH